VPTIVTHAAVGAALAQLGPRSVSRGRLTLALAVLSVFPDLDVVAFHFDVPYSHWLGHRGFSHSLLFAVLVAALVARFDFRQVPLGSRERWAVFGLCAVAIASHGVLDAFTDGGLGIAFFLPFTADRYFFPVQPLAVSPIGVSSFLRGPAVAVLTSEVVHVWVPLAVALVLARVIRSPLRRRSTR
jgi:inner membrane protein